jgi:hypothetical protein
LAICAVTQEEKQRDLSRNDSVGMKTNSRVRWWGRMKIESTWLGSGSPKDNRWSDSQSSFYREWTRMDANNFQARIQWRYRRPLALIRVHSR